MPHTMNISKRMAIALLAMLLAVPSCAFAQRVEGDRAAAQGLYEAEVPVRSQAEAERTAGFARGLAQVLTRLSGDRAVAGQPGVSKELRRASDYVAGYDYRQDQGVSPSTGAPSFTTTLVVRFDGARIDDIAAALGLAVWPQPRPKPVLWLAIDDGSGPRLVDVGKSQAARSALDQAQERGYRLGLPSGTAAEQAAVGAIWRGDVAAIANISSRYSPPMQLVGKLYRSGGGWRADWTFIDHGKAISSWTSNDRSALRAMEAGANGAADALVARYAKAQSIGPAGRYRVVFTGLDGSLDYMQLVAWLRGQPVVRDMKPLHATAGQLEFELELATGVAGLRRVLDDGLLVEVGAGDPPTFHLR